MDRCEICNKQSDHTHHINEQNKADENGNIGHFHKNKKKFKWKGFVFTYWWSGERQLLALVT